MTSSWSAAFTEAPPASRVPHRLRHVADIVTALGERGDDVDGEGAEFHQHDPARVRDAGDEQCRTRRCAEVGGDGIGEPELPSAVDP